MKYVAFLRGINAGITVKMDALKKAFESAGFEGVKIVLASGNVIFESGITDEKGPEEKIEKAIEEALGVRSQAVVRKIEELRTLLESGPFKDIDITPQTRLYVTFLKNNPEKAPPLPADGKGYTILGISGKAVFSMVDLSRGGTPDLMLTLDREFGKSNTTRNLNTIEKVLGAAG